MLGLKKTLVKAKTNGRLRLLSNDNNNVLCHAMNVKEQM